MTRRAVKYSQWSDITPEQLRLAKERTSFLCLPHIVLATPVQRLLENAYLQGCADTADVAAKMLARAHQTPPIKHVPDGMA